MVTAKESNILEVWYLAFLKFFLCVLSKLIKTMKENKHTQKTREKQITNKKNSKSNIKIVNDILHLMKFLINTDESTHPIVIQTIEIYNSKIDYL